MNNVFIRGGGSLDSSHTNLSCRKEGDLNG